MRSTSKPEPSTAALDALWTWLSAARAAPHHGGRIAALAAAMSLFAVLMSPPTSGASISQDLALSGYARGYGIVWESPPYYFMAPSAESGELSGGLLHFRQSARWYAAPALTVALETKERLFGGRDAVALAGVLAQPGRHLPYFDWTATTSDESYYAEATIDRFWIDVAAGPVQARIGRQRVAWGTNLVWNPIDIFNPSSILDFDNEEKPGTDAARVEFYMGPTSELDVAWAPGRYSDDTDAAARLKVNMWGYDWMLLGGRRGTDDLVGFAWSGSVADGGFRGEALAGRPHDSAEDEGYLNASVSCDYSFPNSFYVQASALYQSRGATGDAGGLALLEAYLRDDLLSGQWSVFGEVACDLSPLWHADVSAIVNPLDDSYYVGPSLRWSAAPNVDVTAQALVFEGREGTEFGDQGQLWMLRAQYSF